MNYLDQECCKKDTNPVGVPVGIPEVFLKLDTILKLLEYHNELLNSLEIKLEPILRKTIELEGSSAKKLEGEKLIETPLFRALHELEDKVQSRSIKLGNILDRIVL